VEVGRSHGVKPSNLVGAIANEIGLDSKFIGRIEIYDHHSTVDLPQGLPKDLMAILKRTRVAGQPLAISRVADGAPIANPYQSPRPFRGPAAEGAPRPFKPRPAGDKPFKPKAKAGYPKRKPGDSG